MATDPTDLGLVATDGRGLHKLSDIAEELERLAATWLNRGGETPWWCDMNSDGYAMVMRLYQLPSGESVRLADIKADPLSFDSAMRQAERCLRCRAQAQTDGFYTDCILPGITGEMAGYADADRRAHWQSIGIKGAYLTPRCFGKTGKPRYEWRVRRCEGPARRQVELLRLMGRMVEVGGMRAVEVER